MLYKNTLPLDQRRSQNNQSSLEDRIWIEKKYLPSLEGSVLYVGVKYYTSFYHELIKNPELFTTVDLDLEVAKFGSPYAHYVDRVENFLDSSPCFDHISLFGLFGCDHSIVNDSKQIIPILNKCYSKTNKTIHFGTSTNAFSIEDSKKMIENSDLKNAIEIESFVCQPSPIHSRVYMFWGKKC